MLLFSKIAVSLFQINDTHLPMKMTTPFRIFAVALLALTFFVVSGCKKDKKTIATITIVSKTGAPVPGATVKIYSACSECPGAPGGDRFDTTEMGFLTQITNGTGKVSYDFTDYYKKGQAGFAVLDIKAVKGELKGNGVIKIEEETVNEETITIE